MVPLARSDGERVRHPGDPCAPLLASPPPPPAVGSLGSAFCPLDTFVRPVNRVRLSALWSGCLVSRMSLRRACAGWAGLPFSPPLFYLLKRLHTIKRASFKCTGDEFGHCNQSSTTVKIHNNLLPSDVSPRPPHPIPPPQPLLLSITIIFP